MRTMVSEANLVLDSTIKRNGQHDSWNTFLQTVDRDLEKLLILPDMVYPFHPSTGMIADPNVIEWLVNTLKEKTELTSTDIAIFCATSGEVSPGKVASLLGYDNLSRDQDVELIEARNDSELIDQIRDHPVATVLSPRFSVNGQGPISHSKFLNELDQITSSKTMFKDQICFSVLDGIFLNCGHSYRADRVFLSKDPASIDGLISTLLGSSKVTHFDEREIQRIVSNLDVSPSSDSDLPEKMMQFGYRIYAKASGDLVPPQMEK